MTIKRHASESASPRSGRNTPPQVKKEKVAGLSRMEQAAIRDVQKPVREHHAFSFEFDEGNLLCRSEEKCSELVRKSSGYHTRLLNDLHESKTFTVFSRSMVQSIGYIGQIYL